MKYRGLIETFVDVEADSEEEAAIKMVEVICEQLKAHPEYFTIWENDDAGTD